MKKSTIFLIFFTAAVYSTTPILAQNNDTGKGTSGATRQSSVPSTTESLSGSPANDTVSNATKADNSGTGNTASAAEPGAEHAPGGSSDYNNRPNDQHNSGNWGLLGLLGLFGLLGYLRPANGRTT